MVAWFGAAKICGFLTGTGRYSDDLNLPARPHALMVSSPIAA
jgi:hypothetical protein